jgi:hypothetical protein
MPESWDELTVEEKLELLLRDKASRQDIQTLVSTIHQLGDAVVNLQNEISELLRKLSPPTAPEP